MKYFEKFFFEKGVTPNRFKKILCGINLIFCAIIVVFIFFLLINLNNSTGQSFFGYILAIALCVISLGYSFVVGIVLDGQMNIFSNNLEKLNKKLQELEKDNRESLNTINKKLQELEKENRESLNAIHKKLDTIENLCMKKE